MRATSAKVPAIFALPRREGISPWPRSNRGSKAACLFILRPSPGATTCCSRGNRSRGRPADARGDPPRTSRQSLPVGKLPASLPAGGRGTQAVNAGHTLGVSGYREGKHSTWAIVWFSPKPTLMTLDDRTTDRQPDSHAAAFGRVERLEQVLHRFGIKPHPRIPRGQPHPTALVPFRSYEQLSRTVFDRRHRVDCILDQI